MRRHAPVWPVGGPAKSVDSQPLSQHLWQKSEPRAQVDKATLALRVQPQPLSAMAAISASCMNAIGAAGRAVAPAASSAVQRQQQHRRRRAAVRAQVSPGTEQRSQCTMHVAVFQPGVTPLPQAWQRLQDAVGLRSGGTRSGSGGGNRGQPRSAKEAALQFYDFYNTKQIDRIVDELIADDCVYEVGGFCSFLVSPCHVWAPPRGLPPRPVAACTPAELHCAAPRLGLPGACGCTASARNCIALPPANAWVCRTWCTRSHLWARQPLEPTLLRCDSRQRRG